MLKKSIFWVFVLLFPVIVLELLFRIYIQLIQGHELRDHYAGGNVFEISYPAYVRLRALSSWSTYSINEDGLLGDRLSTGKKGSVKILALGGSTSFFGNYMGKLKERYLSVNLEVPDDEVLFASAGTPGYVVYQSLVNFQTRLVNYQPDIIVIYHGINDLLPLRLRGVDPNDFYDFTAKNTTLLGSTINFRDGILDASAFYTLAYNQLLYIKRRQLDYWYTREDLDKIQRFEKNLEMLIAIARARGIDVVLLTFAHNVVSQGERTTWGISENVAQGIDNNNMSVQRLAAKFHLPVVDVANRLNGKKEYFTDFCHFTSAGVDALVDEVYPLVSELISKRRSGKL